MNENDVWQDLRVIFKALFLIPIFGIFFGIFWFAEMLNRLDSQAPNLFYKLNKTFGYSEPRWFFVPVLLALFFPLKASGFALKVFAPIVLSIAGNQEEPAVPISNDHEVRTGNLNIE